MILLIMCLLIIVIGVRFLILAHKPKPNSTSRRETLRLIIGILTLTMFLAYSFLCYSIAQAQNMAYKSTAAVSSYESRIIEK